MALSNHTNSMQSDELAGRKPSRFSENIQRHLSYTAFMALVPYPSESFKEALDEYAITASNRIMACTLRYSWVDPRRFLDSQQQSLRMESGRPQGQIAISDDMCERAGHVPGQV